MDRIIGWRLGLRIDMAIIPLRVLQDLGSLLKIALEQGGLLPRYRIQASKVIFHQCFSVL